MRAIILAAGRGSRMGNLTEHYPKCMVSLRGKPLFDWQREALQASGVNEIGVVTGYHQEAFIGYDVTRFQNTRWADTNMVRSLECAENWLSSETCIISYGDIFYEPKAVQQLTHSSAALSVLYDFNWRKLWEARFDDVLSDAETFRIDSAQRITEIGNRAVSIDEIQGQYMGLLKFTPQGWNIVRRHLATLAPAEINKLSMTSLLNQLILKGESLTGIAYHGVWGEVDSASDLAFYEQYLKSKAAS